MRNATRSATTRRIAIGVVTLALAAGLPAPEAEAAATLACPWTGNRVQVVVTNGKDGQRACNAVCIWRYPGGLFRGQGGAVVDSGQSKSVFNGTAPGKVESVATSDLTCNR